MTTVLLKNMSLEYLKDQGGDFFSSEAFKNATDLFDKYKLPITDEPAESKDALVLPLQTLKDLIVEQYYEDIIEDKDTAKITDLLFIALSGKYSNAPTYKLRKYITAASSQIKPSTDFLVSTINNNIFLNIAKRNRDEAKKKGVSFIDDLLKPEDTDNVLADIANKSKFYGDNTSISIYDDVQHQHDIVAQVLNDQVGYISNSTSVSTVRTHLIGKLPVANKDMLQMCSSLKAKLFNNYFERASFSLGGYNFNNPDIETTNAEFQIKNMKATLSLRNGGYPLIVLREHILNELEFIIVHNRNTKDYRIELFSANGERLTHNITECTTLDNNTLKVAVSEPFTGEALLLIDRVNTGLISTQNLFYYYRDLGGERLERYRHEYWDGNTIEILVNGYTDGYFFFNIRTTTSLKPIDAESVKVTKDSITIKLPKDIKEAVEIVLLPTYKVLGNIAHTKVTHENVKTFLSTINPFDVNVQAWSI